MKTLHITLITLFFSLSLFSQEKLEKGDVLSNFTIQTIEGKNIEIEDLRGKVVQINFFATWCRPCIKELDHIQAELLNDFDADEYYFIAIGRGHVANDLKTFKSSKGFEFPMAYDTDKSSFLRFSEKGIPLNIIIDQQGEIIFKETGYSPSSFKQMEKAIKRAIK